MKSKFLKRTLSILMAALTVAGTMFGSATPAFAAEQLDATDPEQLDRYGLMFECPEHYVKVNGEIHAIPYEPSGSMDQAR